MSKQPVIVITGASGMLGSYLVDYFAGRGWQVRALRQGTSGPSRPTGRVEYFDYDLASAPPEAALRGADYLVHTAYVKDDRQHPDAYRLNIDGAKRLLAASRRHKLRKNLFMSTMSAHKDAVSVYGRQKAAIEKLFNTQRDAVLRSGLIIGNGALIKQIVAFMRTKHLAPLIDGGNQPLQVIAIYDEARVIETILTGAWHGSFTIGTPEVYSYREFYLTVIRKLGLKAVVVPVPFWVPLLAIRIVKWLHLPLGVTEDNLWGLKKLQAFETLPDLERLGIRLDTLEEMLEDPAVTASL